MKALIVGASGHNGGNVARRLTAQGHRVRGLVRDVARAVPGLDEVIRGDVTTGDGLEAALADVDVAFYFVHSLGGSGRRTDERDLQAAGRFVRAARDSGLRRAVFFTTLAMPEGVEPPLYQRNRMRVEQILLEGIPGTTAVRAGMVVGAGSRGLLPYVRLVQRLSIIPLGPWRANRMAVIDPVTVAEALITAGTDDTLAGRAVDVPASAQPTHEQLIRTVGDALARHPRIVPTPVTATCLDAALLSAVTGESYAFCRYLSSINRHDYVVDPERSRPLAHLTPRPLREALDDAVRHLREPGRPGSPLTVQARR